MIFIPGWLITFATFPGAIVHAAAYRFFCDLAGVKVYQVNYYTGYLTHDPIPSIGKALLIAFAPLFVNTLFCMALTFPAVFPIFFLQSTDYPGVFVLLLWGGLAIGMHAFPRKENIAHFVDSVTGSQRKSFLYYVGRALAMLMAVVAFLRRIWFDLIYAVLVSVAVPWALIQFATKVD